MQERTECIHESMASSVSGGEDPGQELQLLELHGWDPCSGDQSQQDCPDLDEARAYARVYLEKEDDVWIFDAHRKKLFLKSKKAMRADKLWMYDDVTMFCLGRASAR